MYRQALRPFLFAVVGHGQKHRDVSAHWYVDPHLFRAAPIREMLCQPLAQLSRIAADNIVFQGAVIRRSVKDLDADLMFGDFVSSSLQGFSHHVKQKPREQRGAGELRSGNNSLGQLPVRIIVEVGERHLTGKR